MMAELENMDISEPTEEHDVTPRAPMDSSKVSPIPFFSEMSKFPVTRDGERVQAQEVAPEIPNPTIGCTDTKKPGEKKQFYEKNDADILPIVGSDDDVDNFGIKHRSETPASHYTEGEIKYTTKEALIRMAQNIIAISGETGCIINETCSPAYSRYKQDLHFRSVKLLGHGSCGEVDLCVDSKTRKAFVRKTIEKAKFKASEAIAPTISDHPNLTKSFGVVLRDSSLQNSKIELYMEYGGDSLFNFCKGRTLSSSEIHNLAKQGLQGLKHMDLYKIKHLDIKPENICIMEDNGSLLLKITDFGTSILSIDRLEFGGVTPEYMAPEMCKYILQLKRKYYFGLSENDITGAVDVFAFALVIMYMYNRCHIMVKVINKGQPTYKGIGAEERKKLQDSLIDWMARDDDGSLVQNLIPDECSLDMRYLLIGMTRPNHKARLTAKQACDLIEGIAGTCLMSEYGPVKNKATRLSVKKNQPYDKSGFYGKGAKKPPSIEIASKKVQIPSTPVSKFEKWNLEQTSQKQQASNKTFGTTSRCVTGAQSLLDTSARSFQGINAARFSGHDTTECIGQPKLVPTSMLNNTSEQSTANIGRSQVQPQALMGSMVTIPIDELIKPLQRAQSGQSTVTREANIQPPIINFQAEGLGTNRARHQPVYAPMEESPSVKGNLPKLDIL